MFGIYGESLFQCGLIVLAAAVVIGLVFLLVNLILGKNLRKKLVQEYGERKSK